MSLRLHLRKDAIPEHPSDHMRRLPGRTALSGADAWDSREPRDRPAILRSIPALPGALMQET